MGQYSLRFRNLSIGLLFVTLTDIIHRMGCGKMQGKNLLLKLINAVLVLPNALCTCIYIINSCICHWPYKRYCGKEILNCEFFITFIDMVSLLLMLHCSRAILSFLPELTACRYHIATLAMPRMIFPLWIQMTFDNKMREQKQPYRSELNNGWLLFFDTIRKLKSIRNCI